MMHGISIAEYSLIEYNKTMSLDAEKHSSLEKNLKTFGAIAFLLLMAEYSRGLFMFGSGEKFFDNPKTSRRRESKKST